MLVFRNVYGADLGLGFRVCLGFSFRWRYSMLVFRNMYGADLGLGFRASILFHELIAHMVVRHEPPPQRTIQGVATTRSSTS